MTKTQKERFRKVKNLIAEGKVDEAYQFSKSSLMNFRHYQDAIDAGLKLRKERARDRN